MTPLAFDRNFDPPRGVAEPLSPLVQRIVCGNPGAFTFTGTNSYVVGGETVAVIDPGPEDDDHLDALLRAIGGKTVSHILVSHSHADHSPLAARLKAITGAKTVAQGPVDPSGNASLRLDASIDTDFTPDHRLSQGDVIDGPGWTIEAVFTPGHMSNHMSFALREERALFSGDHVMAWATSVVAPPDGNMGDYLQSLRLLLTREDAVYFPGHGPARREPLPLVHGYLAHRQMREDAILVRIAQGDRTIPELVRHIYADVDPKLHPAAALSTRAHLDDLVARGLLRENEGVYETVSSRSSGNR